MTLWPDRQISIGKGPVWRKTGNPMKQERLSKAEILLVDALCDQFEGAANRGENPRIEDFLPKAPEEIQHRLFAELLQVEIAGESKSDSSSDTYIERFPQYAQIVRENWPDRAEATVSTPGSDERFPEEMDASIPIGSRFQSVRSFASSGKDSRYSIIKTHAKGGLGEVFIAEDLDLHRRVAVKEIQRFAADDPESRARFLLEAEITGRLEHPGIVPVYSLGASEDGRPYYAMRFIQGESLKEAIESHHTKKFPTPSEKAVEFRQLLTRFVAVCQAVAFAHDRGILHRDLKPANIMLGKFGETLVVDWGLAKVLGKSTSDVSSVSALIPKGKDDSSETRHGAVVGTPAYMSPEQARGEVDGLGPTSDIYSLGATLFSIVTGERPVQGQSTAELLRNVREGKTELTGRSLKGANLPLLAICRMAMARESTHRFPTALALAADVERWLADEPVEAYRESTMAQVRRWIKRHTTAVSTASAALLVLILALAGGSVALGFKNNELQEANGKQIQATQAAEAARKAEERARKASDKAREAAEKAKRKADLAQQAAEEAKKQAEIAQKAAEKSAKEEKEANALAQSRLVQVREHNRVLKGIFQDINVNSAKAKGVPLSAQLAKRLIQASKLLNADSVDEAYYVGELQTSLGNALASLGYPKDAIELHAKALDITSKVLGPEGEATLTCMDNLANAYGDAEQLDKSIPLFEKTLELRRKVLGPNHNDTLRTMNNLAIVYERGGETKKALAMLETALGAMKNAHGADHDDYLAAMNNLAYSYQANGQYPKSKDYFQEAHDKWLVKYGPDHHYVLGTKVGLGAALVLVDEKEKAIEILAQANEGTTKHLGDDHPTTLAAANKYAWALSLTGNTERAIELHKTSLEKKKIKLGADNPATLASMANLASAYIEAGKFDKAIPLLEETLKLKKAKYGENNSEYMRTFSALGRAHLMAKEFEKALLIYKQDYAATLAKYGPTHPETDTSHHNLCITYLRAGAFEEGKATIEEYIDKKRKAAKPGETEFADLLYRFANEHFEAKLFAECQKLLEECVLLRKQYGKEAWRVFLTQSLLGAALSEQKKYAEAEPMLKEAFEGLTKESEAIPKNFKKSISNTAARLAKMYEAQGQAEEAEKWKKKEAELTPKVETPK